VEAGGRSGKDDRKPKCIGSVELDKRKTSCRLVEWITERNTEMFFRRLYSLPAVLVAGVGLERVPSTKKNSFDAFYQSWFGKSQ
jgi:hypothetical protein